MMRLIKCIFSLAVLQCATLSVSSQTSSARFSHLTTEDGLAQNMVDCMIQDRHGFIWIGTWNGLCRYDGYDFEVFNRQDQKEFNLRNNFIHALHEDGFGNIWVGTGNGLYLYIYDKKTFVEVEPSGTGFGANHVFHSIEKFDDRHLLIGTRDQVSLIETIEPNGQFEIRHKIKIGQRPGDLAGTLINTMSAGTPNSIWIGSDGGLHQVDSLLDLVKVYTHDTGDVLTLSNSVVVDLFHSKSGKLWVGTEAGLNSFDPISETFLRYYNDPSNPNSLPHNTIMNLLEDSQGNIVIATLGGLSILDKKGTSFSNYYHQPDDVFSLNNDFINCLMLDNANNIWIGTERGGINIYNARQNTFEQFKSEINNTNSLSHNTVNSIFEDKNYLWVGTAGGGLNRLSKSSQNVKRYKFDVDDNRTISSNFVTSIYRTPQGKLWAGTWGQGISILENEGTSQEYFRRLTVDNSSMSSNFISSIVKDDFGRLWIGTLGGLMMCHLNTEIFSTVYTEESEHHITRVGCLLADERSQLWVGTRRGLVLLELDVGSTRIKQVFSHSDGSTNSLSGDYVISLHQDKKGNTWAGTYGHGINKLTIDGDSYRIDTYSTADGLSNNIIFGIVEDGDGNLWLSTDYGLSRFNPQTGISRNFFKNDGLLNNQYYWSAAFKGADGKLYFGGMNGMDAFYPSWISDDIDRPTVTITDIKLMDESVVPGKEYNGQVVMNKHAAVVEQMSMSYMEKTFSIEFSTLNYQAGDVITYRYMLEGFDKDWNVMRSPRHFVTYTNLVPGEYRFLVKAAGSDGVFGNSSTELKIQVTPPFWQTWWFRVSFVLSLVAMVFGYVRYRTFILKRQKAVLERQVALRTDEINRQKEALSFQAVQLQSSNEELEHKQELIEGQNRKLEDQNKEILEQRDEVIELNNKLNMVSQLKLSFFTNISHEFRTPLTLILGPLERLLSNAHLKDEIRNTLELMNRNAQRLLHLINEIMEFRKIEKGKIELRVSHGNIAAFCRRIFEAFEPLSEIKKISFCFESNTKTDNLWYDNQKIENILYNLLSNAFKYTPNGGQIRMEVSTISYEESRLEKTGDFGQQENNVVSIKIIDSGEGISEENLPLIFKRFYRIESENAFKIGGSGIGLALTEELIKTHHGEIFVSSQPGEGSVFEIQFPCLKGAYAMDELKVTEDESSILNQVEILKNELLIHEESNDEHKELVLDKDKNTILVVEDNADLRKFISLKLSDHYNIVEASNGEKGLELAKSFNPDLMVSDVMMPKMDGFELCASIKNNFSTSHIPIILLTAKSSVENQIEGLQIGADDYLPKPFNFDLLEARISNLIESRQLLKQRFADEENFSIKELSTNSRDQQFLEAAEKVVYEQLSNGEFGSKDLVLTLGVSRSLLHKKLTALTNKSASEFINHIRMSEAKKRLVNPDLNISEVAYAVGYNDPKYFSRLFSKHFGKSPKEYQAMVLGLN